MHSDLPFDKIQASGNDFVLIRETPTQAIVAQLCDRRYGVGADGVMVFRGIHRGTVQFDHYDPDGSQSFCLNGTRAALDRLRDELPHQGQVICEQVPMRYQLEQKAAVYVHSSPVTPVICHLVGNGLPGFFADPGNPHFVLVDAIPEQQFEDIAPTIRADESLHLGGVNAHLVIKDGHQWRIRSYERGVEGFTLACGSGIIAAALTLHHLKHPGPFLFKPEGKGQIHVSIRDSMLKMTGDTQWVASGVWKCGSS